MEKAVIAERFTESYRTFNLSKVEDSGDKKKIEIVHTCPKRRVSASMVLEYKGREHKIAPIGCLDCHEEAIVGVFPENDYVGFDTRGPYAYPTDFEP